MKKSMYLFLGIPQPKSVDLMSLEMPNVETTDSSRSILQSIYAFDPVTRLPTGDIMCYLSSSTPPEVKQFVIDNLMIDTSSQKLPSLPEGIDEDTAFNLSRKVDESVDSYRSRISQYMEQQVNIRDMAIESAKREKAVSESAE